MDMDILFVVISHETPKSKKKDFVRKWKILDIILVYRPSMKFLKINKKEKKILLTLPET